jgi:hypothetical protein
VRTQPAEFHAAARLGFWSALAAGVLGILYAAGFLVANAIAPIASWWRPHAEWNATTLLALRVFGFALISLLLMTLVNLVLFANLHTFAPDSRRPVTRVGLLFISMYCLLVTGAYFVQLVVVFPALQQGTAAGLDQFELTNTRSALAAVYCLGYAFMALGMFCMIPVFSQSFAGRSQLERWLRGSFLAGGLANLLGIPMVLFSSPQFTEVAGIAMSVVPPLPLLLLIPYFRRLLATRPA